MHPKREIGTKAFGRQPQGDRLSALGGPVERFNNLDIEETFRSIRFRLSIMCDTARKIDQLWRELIARCKRTYARAPSDRDGGFQSTDVLIRRLDAYFSLGADHLIGRGVGGAETTGEGREAISRKSHDRSGRFFDGLKPVIRSSTGEGGDFCGLIPK